MFFFNKDKDKTEQPETDKEDQETAWEAADNDRLLKMQKDYDAQTIAWNSEKDRLLKMLTEHEDDKRAWELEKDRLLKMITEQEAQKRTMDAEIDRLLKTSKELETKVCPGKKTLKYSVAVKKAIGIKNQNALSYL